MVRNEVHGASRERLGRVLESADVLVNLSGVSVLRAEHMVVPMRIYLETDPVLPQIEVARGKQFTIDLLAAHTHHFNYGENFGAADCTVPIEGFHYLPTRRLRRDRVRLCPAQPGRTPHRRGLPRLSPRPRAGRSTGRRAGSGAAVD